MSQSGFCGAVLGTAGSAQSTEPDWQRFRAVPAGRQMVLANQPTPDVYVLCSGWGFRFMQLPNGRRQILGFLLPGDLLTGSLFQDHMHFSVKALTAVQVSAMSRTEVFTRIAANMEIVRAAAACCAAETHASDNLIAALGRLSAEERIAFLFLHLMRRITSRSEIHDARYPMPLRQQHIADAVGLSPVHVSRVLGAFRERGIADLSRGTLEVFDRRELQRLGGLN
jgi:CRP-like cAMP-binding protein